MRSGLKAAGGVLLLLGLYLGLWPVPVDPIAWEPPPDTTGSGPYADNRRLDPLESIDIGDHHGPEDLAIDAQGRIYVPTEDGTILRVSPDRDGSSGTKVESIANTKGRPLGIELDARGNLLVADAFLGLLQVSPDGEVTVLADEADGVPILYADDLDIARDGKVYLSDASTRFGAKRAGSTMLASRLEIIEHRRSGRLLEYDPATGKARTLLDGLSFANGVAVAHDDSFVLVNETGEYRVIRYHLRGPKAGTHDVFIDQLPGFPDNIGRGLDGVYWLALIAPRNKLLDRMADSPMLRRLVLRLPQVMQPQPVPHAHLLSLDRNGRVLDDLQRSGADALYTGASETADHLYLGSLTSPDLKRWRKRGLAPRPR